MRLEALANPVVLKWARCMAGLTQEDAARKANVKPSRLKDWEEGRLHPSIIQLRKISDIYKRPLALFYLNEPPEDDEFPIDFRRLHPLNESPATPELRLAIREAHARRETALELFNDLQEEPPSFPIKAFLSEDPETVGECVRGALVTGPSPPEGESRVAFNFWRSAAENAGVLVFQAGDIALSEMRGFSIADRPLPAVVLNIKDAYTARGFTLMHELAHIAISRAGLCVLEDLGPTSETQRIEKFCNHVAGAVLLPASSLLNAPEVPRIKVSRISDGALKSLGTRYGTSEEAVLRRLVVLKRVDAAYYERKREDFLRAYSKLTGKKTETGGFAPPSTLALAHSGRLFSRLVLDAYDEERITSSDVATYLGVRAKHIEKIRAAIDSPPTPAEDGR